MAVWPGRLSLDLRWRAAPSRQRALVGIQRAGQLAAPLQPTRGLEPGAAPIRGSGPVRGPPSGVDLAALPRGADAAVIKQPEAQCAAQDHH